MGLGARKAVSWGGEPPLDTEEAKRRLALVAFEIFALKGLRKTFLAEVARAAHISRPTLYNHFPTKESLIFAVLGVEVVPWLQMLRPRMMRFSTAQERLVEGTLYAIEELPKTQVLKFILEPEYMQMVANGDPEMERTLAFTLESLEPVFLLAPDLRERGLEKAELSYRTIMSHVQWRVGEARSREQLRQMLHHTLVPAMGLQPLSARNI